MSDIAVKISKPSLQIGIQKKEATVKISEEPSFQIGIEKKGILVGIEKKETSVKISGEVLDMLNTDRFKSCQIPAPAPDGAIKIFTTPNPYVAGTLTIYRDQSALRREGDFKELDPDTGTFETTVAPDSDEVIWCNYIIKI